MINQNSKVYLYSSSSCSQVRKVRQGSPLARNLRPVQAQGLPRMRKVKQALTQARKGRAPHYLQELLDFAVKKDCFQGSIISFSFPLIFFSFSSLLLAFLLGNNCGPVCVDVKGSCYYACGLEPHANYCVCSACFGCCCKLVQYRVP